MIMKYYRLALLAATAVVPFVTTGQQEKVVRMRDSNSFEPKTITVKAGDTLVWKNASSMSHSVTDVPSLAIQAKDAALPANAKEFNSDLIPPGKDWSHTFSVPGTYNYFCIPHEALGMVGTVVVTK
jgi:plastocyanin